MHYSLCCCLHHGLRLKPLKSPVIPDDEPLRIFLCVCVSFCQAEEVDILGLNGQVYKGRLTTRTVKNMDPGLPTIIPKEGHYLGRMSCS